ncbi:Transketolase, thiamine diphosphate binding domain-containing protein [Paraphysoderma sedebokerense]|nr:Transketolase, thiamine diphosphate binding domain-containing protein [Paraphysoderma sedebokerense]
MTVTPFTDLDWRSINTIRTLAADVVQKANSGHPGAPMGCAPMAHVLFHKFMKANPQNPKWISRDRFVLSNGHACVLQYILLHLCGYGVTMEDLKSFRQLDSKTPGHPECFLTPGIEVSTGPLGQGIANAVGLAMAEAHMAATFNRDNFNVIDNFTYVILGDGCLQEGVHAEAVSLAGHLKLGKLIALYDDNQITIDGDTALGFTEDVCKRFEAYGWHTSVVSDGNSNLASLAAAIEEAKNVKDKPSLIKIRTTIGFGSSKAGTDKVHGAPLGADDIVKVKTTFGFDTNQFFVVPNEVYAFYEDFKKRGASAESQWNAMFDQYKAKYPDLANDLNRRVNGQLPSNLPSLLPKYSPSDAAVATRKLSENVLNAIAPSLPELFGGSADLTGSNLTRWKGSKDFQHPSTQLGDYSGRYIRFGVREHGMAATCNGIAAYGGLIPFGATFLNFISYALGASRLSALSHHQVLYIMTHDSIGLGEDGPTHQPVETLATLRATPNTLNFRPADGNEVSGSYYAALLNRKRPSVLALSRQNVPHLPNTSIEGTLKGAYPILIPSSAPQLILVATGTETSLAFSAGQKLNSSGLATKVVSMPCWELFSEQSKEYKLSVFDKGVPVLSVEALSVFGWDRYAHASIGMISFGASGPFKEVYKKFGITEEEIEKKGKMLVEWYKGKVAESKIEKPW